jgi:acetyltransferase-like isoleucine patch superfamily enzyme
MLKITEKEILDFRKHGKKILKEVGFRPGENPARKWHQYKHPLRQAKNYIIVIICRYLPPCEFKNDLYRLMGAQIGKNVSIANDSILDTIFPELIKIEDNVIIGWGTKIFTHEFTPMKFRVGSVLIKKNSMIGESSIVRPAVTIGKDSMIAAMSFANEDVEDGTLEGGVPIHVIKHHQRVFQRKRRRLL